MITPPPRGWLADEIQAPSLFELNEWYHARRGEAVFPPPDVIPDLAALPGGDDLAKLRIGPGDDYIYEAMGPAYRALSALLPGPDGRVHETRAVMRQHVGFVLGQKLPFHVSITRWDGPRILQYDRLLLPFGPDAGHITHLLVGEAFLRLARG